MQRLADFVATFGYVGYLRPAPGTWGSLASLPVAFIAASVSPWVFWGLIPAMFVAGLWAVRVRSQGAAPHDPPEIVIDEAVGQMIALLPVIIGAFGVGASLVELWPGWIGAFVLFRLFDIWKPGWIGWADKRQDPLGVMLDDVLAGVFAALFVILLGVLFHGLM